MSEGERARLHALLEQIPAAIAIVRGPEFVYELSNAMNRQFTQGRAVVGRRLSEALPELSDFIKLIEHVYRTGESFRGTEVPARLMQSDGVVRDVYLTGAYEPLRNAAGEIDGVLGFAYEVTESVVARKRAEESEAKLRRLYDSGVIGVVYWTREGQLVDANDAFLQMVGYTREELKSGLVRWRDMTPPEFAAADERAFAEMEQRGICTPYEKEYLHKSGERIPIQLGVALWEGSTTEGVAWILDMRAQRRAEAALRLREAQLRAITDTIPALIALIGSDERYLLINRVHEQWFRTASEQVVGRTVRELLGEEGYARVRSRIERVLAGDTVTFEERIAYPDVGLRDVRATYVPHRNAAGAVDGFVVLVLDVTAEKQAERDRVDLLFREQQARAEAEAAVRKRDEFLSIASHELKTPLTTLGLQLQALERLTERGDVPRERAAEGVARMRKQLHRVVALVDELLDVARIAEGRLPLSLDDVDLGELVDELIARFRDEAAAAGSSLTRLGERTLRGTCDRGRLDQVLTNLLTNAVKYGRGQPIDVTVEHVGDRARLIVRDRGLGVPHADRARIFERFERAVSARQYSGLGLGLWIARTIVEAHGGTIALADTAGEGSTFVVELPLSGPSRA